MIIGKLSVQFILSWYLLYFMCCFPVVGKSSSPNGKECIRFKKNFEGVKSEHIRRNCKTLDGEPVCCTAMARRNANEEPRGVGQEQLVPRGTDKTSRGNCKLVKTYFPSPYEAKHMEFARSLMEISHSANRLNALLKFVSSPDEIARNYEWLRYAKLLMEGSIIEDVEKAKAVLSYFEVRRVCRRKGASSSTSKWVEWIEPITVHGRHPFAFAECRHIDAVVKAYPNRNPLQGLDAALSGARPLKFPHSVTAVPIMNVDYIILQSSQMMYDRNGSSPGQPVSRLMQVDGRESHNLELQPVNKHILVDAGTSYFHSSLSWLTCAYSQVGMSFDRIYAWEKSLLDPVAYWKGVPLKWQPYWSFYNAAIGPTPPDQTRSSESEEEVSRPCPTEFIKSVARPHDFVSFKLDIDHPETELDVASSLLNDPTLHALVDEFFFEAHFRCDVMMLCGWGPIEDTPKKEIVLDRPQVMQFFQDVRRKGVRSHMWP